MTQMATPALRLTDCDIVPTYSAKPASQRCPFLLCDRSVTQTHFHFLQGNRNESTSGYKSLLDVIPLRGQHTEKPSIAPVTHGDVNDLWRSTVQQPSIVEVRVFTEITRLSTLPRFQICVSVAVNRLRSKRCSAS